MKGSLPKDLREVPDLGAGGAIVNVHCYRVLRLGRSIVRILLLHSLRF